MLDGVLLLWYILTAGSLLFLIWDLETNTPVTWVMKLAWVLVVLYTGPIGLFIYLLSCRQPLPGTHDSFIAPHWKQSIGSLMHCVAGDATGIILAASVTYGFGLPNGIDLAIEYASAYVVGLLVFQSLFMVLMTREPYLAAVRHSFFPETVSMNMVMTGMLPVKAILMYQVSGGDNPTNPEFWGIMSLATMAGMVVAYPINSWMVRRGIKHGMMSATPSPEQSHGRTAKPHGRTDDRHGATVDPDDATVDPRGTTTDHTTLTGARRGRAATSLPPLQAAVVVVGTTVILVAAIWGTSLIIPLSFG